MILGFILNMLNLRCLSSLAVSGFKNPKPGEEFGLENIDLEVIST